MPVEGLGEKAATVFGQLPRTFPDLLDAFAAATTEEAAEEWDWERWAAEPLAEGRAGWVDSTGGIITAFIVAALKSDLQLPPDHPLPTTPGFGRLVGGEGAPVRAALNQVRGEQARWARILSAEEIGRARILDELLVGVGTRLETRENDQQASAALSEAKVKDFAEGVRAAFEKQCCIRQMFANLGGLSSSKRTIEDSDRRFGLRELREKAPFIETGQAVEFGHVAEGYGRALARSVDGRLYVAMAEKAEKAIDYSQDTALDTILREAATLPPATSERLVLLLSVGARLHSRLLSHPSFRGSARSEPPLGDLAGSFGELEAPGGRKIHVIILPLVNTPFLAILLDAHGSGRLKESVLQPGLTLTGGFNAGPLIVRVADLNAVRELRLRLFRELSTWPADVPEARREQFLSRHVLVEVASEMSFEKGVGPIVVLRKATS